MSVPDSSVDPQIVAVVKAAFAGCLGALDLEWLHGQGSTSPGKVPGSRRG